MKLNELKNKKILILGYGREGKDTFLFLRKLFPSKNIDIADKKRIKKPNKKTLIYSGKNYLKKANSYDVIIKSPGIPLKEVEKINPKKITSQTEIFLDNCPGTVVGVTGTKGKSTTTSLIYEILKKGKKKVHLVGNIGKPVLSYLLKAGKNDIFVFEMSCHQLYGTKKSPHVAVLLNLYPEHLDYYKSFSEYAKAKANIAIHQKRGDYLVFNSGDKEVKKIAKKSKAKKISVKGFFNELNKEAARKVGKIFKVPDSVINKTIKGFKPLPHRLELVGRYKGITFYNDSLATIPEATIGAIKTLKKVETIMLGGFDRGIDFKLLAKEILKNKIKNVILFPTTGEKIWKEIAKQAKGRGLPNHFSTKSMEKAVSFAYKNTSKGKICLLSSASSSFSVFKDYEEKGNLFKKYVKKLSKN